MEAKWKGWSLYVKARALLGWVKYFHRHCLLLSHIGHPVSGDKKSFQVVLVAGESFGSTVCDLGYTKNDSRIIWVLWSLRTLVQLIYHWSFVCRCGVISSHELSLISILNRVYYFTEVFQEPQKKFWRGEQFNAFYVLRELIQSECTTGALFVDVELYPLMNWVWFRSSTGSITSLKVSWNFKRNWGGGAV